MCKRGLENYYPAFYASHLGDIEKLDALRVMRNKFAHHKMDFNKSYPGFVLMSTLASKLLALAWLLQRSPNILLIPGTSSVAHLRENAEAGGLKLPADIVSELDQILQ